MTKEGHDMPICEAFSAVVDYALSRGVRNLAQRPGLWEAQIDEQWWIALNPHQQELTSSHGNKIQFGQCYVEFNGWPAGIITPYDGILAAGALANENTFIAALRSATKAVA
jgi:hypothetical protein